MPELDRRRFLYCIGGVSALAGLSSAQWLRSHTETDRGTARCGKRNLNELRSLTRCSRALGSSVSVKVYHRDESASNRALNAAFSELALIEQLMSIYRPSSQLSQLNRDGILHHPHPYLRDILRSAQDTSEKTDGAFDVTIQPLWQLYANARKTGGLPSDAEVAIARSLVDWRRLETRSDRVQLHGDGMRITLNGIAQGFAADRVAEALCSHGVEHALIDTGEISTMGARPHDDEWTIGIQHPRNEEAFLSVARLAGRCLATSGDYATVFSHDHVHHHLFDPRTGRSPTELSSVSIAANTALEADSLSTAVFVLGLDAGAALIHDTPGVDAMLVDKNGRTMVTAGFPVA